MSFQKNAGAVRRFARLTRFGAWLQALHHKLTPPPFRLLQIGSAFWQSRALYVAARLDIAGALGDDELAATDIAARLGTNPDATGRLLRLLAAMGIFEETSAQRFRNNKTSNFLRPERPDNVRAMILLHNADAMSRPWYEQLENGIRRGVPPFQLSHGKELFAYLDDNAELDALFSQAMSSVEALTGDSFATDFDWGRFARIIDVGGSLGAKSAAILKHHPKLTALVIDRPQVIAQAENRKTERQQFAAGNMLASVPPARDEQDIYLLSAILHAFDDATCRQVLGNLATACGRTGARIALLEMVLPESHADLVGASFDLQMLMGTRGRERTLSHWQALFTASRLQLEEVVGLQSFGNILLLRTQPQ
ncbi:MAG: methyltransferase [Proteobacteria bacterium]|nr:methyltransferase [Pseudomonadota bacterium]